MKSEADKYAGLVTALAVLIVVFYTKGNYDGWDIFLGFVGLILGWKYSKSIDKSDLFFTTLVGFLMAISILAILFGTIQVLPVLQTLIQALIQAFSNGNFELDYTLIIFLVTGGLISSILHFQAIFGKKQQDKD